MPQPLQENTQIGDILHEWVIKEYIQYDHPRAWYIIMGVFGLFFLAYSIVSGNLLFAAIIILSAIILFMQSKQSPVDVGIAVTDAGVVVGHRFYPYKELEDFFIVYQPPEVKMLYIDTKSPLRPLLRLPLGDKNPIQIRADLRQFLTENLDKEEEPLSDKFGRWWQI